MWAMMIGVARSRIEQPDVSPGYHSLHGQLVMGVAKADQVGRKRRLCRGVDHVVQPLFDLVTMTMGHENPQAGDDNQSLRWQWTDKMAMVTIAGHPENRAFKFKFDFIDRILMVAKVQNQVRPVDLRQQTADAISPPMGVRHNQHASLAAPGQAVEGIFDTFHRFKHRYDVAGDGQRWRAPARDG